METINRTTYKTTTFEIGKTKFSVTIVTGKLNYINVLKHTAIRSLGKDYQTFEEAISAYKNPQMKVELLKIEMGF
jgi:hypothetical protein